MPRNLATNSKATRNITFELEPGVKKKLEELAKRQERSLSFLVRSAVKQFLAAIDTEGKAGA